MLNNKFVDLNGLAEGLSNAKQYVDEALSAGPQSSSPGADLINLEARIAALEALLAPYSSTEFSVSDGTTTVNKWILTKPRLANKLKLQEGCYDGNLEKPALLSRVDEVLYALGYDVESSEEYDETTGDYNSTYYMSMNNPENLKPFSELDSNIRGIVFPGYWDNMLTFTGAAENQLDWIVISKNVPIENNMLFDIPNVVKEIYYDDTPPEHKWGQTNAVVLTVDTEGR